MRGDRRLKSWAPSALTLAWLLLALVGFAVHVNGYYPLSEWLSFFWARAWVAALVFVAASLSVGIRLLQLLRVRSSRLLDRYSLAFALGVLAFALGIFVTGYVGLLGRAFFFIWPALLLASGRSSFRELRRVARHLRPLRGKWVLPQTPMQALAALLIVIGLLTLYVQGTAPDSITFDARWYHLPIAENYAVTGRIRPFPEGYYLAAYPHLASLLYTWALLAPGEISHRLCLVVHVEFMLLLATLAGISALASRLVSRTRLSYAGAALFLFPSTIVSEMRLNGAADDVLAFWAAPIGLVLLRYWADGSRINAVLLGALIGAAGLTKYQAIYPLVAVALVVAVDAARRRSLRPALVAAGVALAVSSPHWLKNWLAYGDPLYPNLNRWLPDHPFFHGARAWLKQYYWLHGPHQTTAEKLVGVWRALVDFSFLPHDWAASEGGRPLFGSLFTLLLPLLYWVRPRGRVLLLAACVHVGLVVWYFTYRYDRFLQSIVPWMAACTAACLASVWRTGRPELRTAAALLVLFQILVGADVPFLKGALLRAASDHIAAGDEKNYARTPYPGSELAPIGEKLRDQNALLVGHDFHDSLGVGVPTICDNPAWQGSIDYVALDTPAKTLRKWLSLGATHVLLHRTKGEGSREDLARDAVLGRAKVAFTRTPFVVADHEVARLVNRTPSRSDREPTRIAWLGCGDTALGVYSPAGFAAGTPDRRLTSEALREDPDAALRTVNAVWYRPKCRDARAAKKLLSKRFEQVLRADDAVLVVRAP